MAEEQKSARQIKREQNQAGVAETKESVLALKAERTKKRGKSVTTDGGGHLVTADSDEHPTIGFAESMLKRQSEMKEAQAVAQRIEDSDKYQYFQKCASCNGHAIYFTENPMGRTICAAKTDNPGDDRITWFSTYKSATQGYYQRDIKCQCCMKEGRSGSVRVNFVGSDEAGPQFNVGGKFVRFVYKVAKSKAIFDEEGEIPAHTGNRLEGSLNG